MVDCGLTFVHFNLKKKLWLTIKNYNDCLFIDAPRQGAFFMPRGRGRRQQGNEAERQ